MASHEKSTSQRSQLPAAVKQRTTLEASLRQLDLTGHVQQGTELHSIVPEQPMRDHAPDS